MFPYIETCCSLPRERKRRSFLLVLSLERMRVCLWLFTLSLSVHWQELSLVKSALLAPAPTPIRRLLRPFSGRSSETSFECTYTPVLYQAMRLADSRQVKAMAKEEERAEIWVFLPPREQEQISVTIVSRTRETESRRFLCPYSTWVYIT